MKKIKKYYPLIVGLVLLISVAAYGTRAYFSDSTSQEAGIELTLGNVEISSDSGSWIYEPEIATSNYNNQLLVNKEVINTQSNTKVDIGKQIKVTNVRPGDSFSRIFTFKNEGSLAANLIIDNSDILDKKNGPFEIGFGVRNDSKKILKDEPIFLAADSDVEIEMTISISTDDTHNDKYNLPTDKDILNLMTDNIAVKLIQADATATAE